MEQNKFTPSSIGEIEFSVPLYQRLFEWEEAQILQLLFDLKESFKINPEKPYYIGMLTVFAECNVKYSLVDGQQRFTVLTLMALAFRGVEWENFLKTISGKTRLSFFARTDDTNYLENKINNIKGDSYINIKMEKGIEIIENFLCEIAERDEQKKFVEYVYNKATFFISKLPKDYNLQDLNRYFESMNATGKNLENYEILKVELLKKVDEDKKEFYTKIWNAVSSMDKCLIRQVSDKEDVNSFRRRKIIALNQLDCVTTVFETCNDLQRNLRSDNSNSIKNIPADPKKPSNKILTKSERSILNFSEFLLQILWLHLTEKSENSRTDFFNTNKLLETFKINLKDDQVQFFLDNLLRYRIIYDEYIVRIRQDENIITNYFINSFQEEDGQKENVVQFQSMLYVSTTSHLWLSPILLHLNANLKGTNYSTLLIYLKTWDNNRHQSIGKLNYPTIERYWFWRLDYYLWENADEHFTGDQLSIAKKYIFKTNRSIEHISPQNLLSHDQRLIDEKYVDSFGNLTMISGGQNSALQNETFQVKKAHVQAFIEGSRGGTIESLKMLDLYQYDIWDNNSISEHFRKMLQVLINSFDRDEEAQKTLLAQKKELILN